MSVECLPTLGDWKQGHFIYDRLLGNETVVREVACVHQIVVWESSVVKPSEMAAVILAVNDWILD